MSHSTTQQESQLNAQLATVKKTKQRLQKEFERTSKQSEKLK